jgi:hypothetical protein
MFLLTILDLHQHSRWDPLRPIASPEGFPKPFGAFTPDHESASEI